MIKLRSGYFEDMVESIKRGKKRIVVFGAGVIGTVVVPEILRIYGLESYVDCYIDNDEKCWNKTMESPHFSTTIRSPRYMSEVGENTVILLSISRYVDAIRQLEQMECTCNMVCYIVPMMLIYNYAPTVTSGAMKDYTKPQIPKKIHYIWLGKKEIPEKLHYCIDSWKRFCPDYEIVRWDESNYDFFKNDYMKQAYEAGAYGFVPDYARLDILHTYGGLYMDTDVEVIRNLDELLYQDAFCGVEKWQVINFGGCSGAVKGHPALKEFLDNRENISYRNMDGSVNKNTCGFYDTQVALKHGYCINGRNQKIAGMNIYSSDYFHPYDYMSGRTECTDNTYTIHHFNGGWLDDKMRKANERAAKEFEELFRQTLSEVNENDR